MENFFGHLKEEALRQFKPPTFEQASAIIDDYVYFYNYEKIQLKTRQTPFETGACLCNHYGVFLFVFYLLGAVQYGRAFF